MSGNIPKCIGAKRRNVRWHTQTYILPSDGPRDCLNFLRIEYEYSFILEKKKRKKTRGMHLWCSCWKWNRCLEYTCVISFSPTSLSSQPTNQLNTFWTSHWNFLDIFSELKWISHICTILGIICLSKGTKISWMRPDQGGAAR